MSAFRKRGGIAANADCHHLYQEAVQDPEAEIDFVEETWAALRDRPAELLREDFCGTAHTACEWVRRDAMHWAVGVDLDADVLEWGRLNNFFTLRNRLAHGIELPSREGAWQAITMSRKALLKLAELHEQARRQVHGVAGP